MNLDSQTLVHVGTELVLIFGITFWLNRRISTLEAQNTALEQKLAAYEKILEAHDKLLKVHHEQLGMIFGRGGPPPKPKSLPPPPPPPERDDDDDDVKDEKIDEMLRDELKDMTKQVNLVFKDKKKKVKDARTTKR
jgi:hypothetical protein